MTTHGIDHSTYPIALGLVLAEACNTNPLIKGEVNPWTRGKFLSHVDTVIQRYFPEETTRNNLNIDRLQKAILINQGVLKAVQVGEFGWDLTQSRPLMEAAHDVSVMTTELFENLMKDDQESFNTNKQTFAQKWETFTCCYDNEIKRAKLFLGY